MMICIKTHLLGPLYTIPMTIRSYSTIWAYFFTKYEGVSFFTSKRKNWTFFSKIENLPLHTQIVVSLLWIESKLTHLEDVFKLLSWYSIFKTFPFIFWMYNKNYAWFLNKNSIKMFFNFWIKKNTNHLRKIRGI